MNILHIFGNGFDINFGLKTSYRHFYDYYKTIENYDPLIIDLKKNIQIESDKWSDLEIRLGEYTENLSKVDFDFIYDDLLEELCNYLENESSNIDISKYNISKFSQDLSVPQNFLEPKDRQAISDFCKNLKTIKGVINIITLNYTQTADLIFEKADLLNEISFSDNITYSFSRIKHLHGYTDSNVILGVNDVSQILNKEFKEDTDYINMYIKKECNNLSKHNIEVQCYSIIDQSSLICLFGCSLGPTDKYIWELIGKRIYAGAKVIIFKTSRNISKRSIRNQMNLINTTINNFLELASTPEYDVTSFKESVKISIGSNIFNFNR